MQWQVAIKKNEWELYVLTYKHMQDSFLSE